MAIEVQRLFAARQVLDVLGDLFAVRGGPSTSAVTAAASSLRGAFDVGSI